MTRSQARGPWMLMEQAAGPVNWRGVNHPKPRGLNRLWSLQAVARGADAVCYFQWRQSRQGAEKFHSGMVSHAGEEGRTYQEVKQLGADLARIAREVTGRPPARRRRPARLARLVGRRPGRPPVPPGGVPGRPAGLAPALWQAHLTTDFAHPEHDLTAYSMVVVPQLYALTDAAVDNLLAYARRRRHPRLRLPHRCRGRGRPGPPRRHGRPAARAVRHPHAARVVAAGRGGSTVECRGLPGHPVVRGAGADGTADDRLPYKGGELDGLPAVLRKDRAWYVSTLPEPEALRDLLASIAA